MLPPESNSNWTKPGKAKPELCRHCYDWTLMPTGERLQPDSQLKLWKCTKCKRGVWRLS